MPLKWYHLPLSAGRVEAVVIQTMNIWQHITRIFRREKEAAPASSGSIYRMGSSSLVTVAGSGQSLAIAAVYRCVKLLSESVANLPMEYLRLRDGLFVPYTGSRLHYLLSVQPDKGTSAFDFWVQVVQQMLLEGNAYIIPVYNPATMQVERLALCGRGTVAHDTVNDTYTVCDIVNGIEGAYDEDEVIHIKNLTLDGKNGLSVLSFARLTLDIAATGDNETLNRFANGGNVHGIISNDTSVRGFGEYQDRELTKTADDIDKKFRNGKRIVSTPGQVDFKQLSLSSADIQFVENRKFTVREVCRFFGVHPSFVFDDTRNTYKSAEMANVAFLSNTLNPILRKIESELQRKLVAPTLYHKYKFQFDRKGLYACDLESRIKYQIQSIEAGLYTVNEWRKEENRPAVTGGDRVLVSANLKGIEEMQGSANLKE